MGWTETYIGSCGWLNGLALYKMQDNDGLTLARILGVNNPKLRHLASGAIDLTEKSRLWKSTARGDSRYQLTMDWRNEARAQHEFITECVQDAIAGSLALCPLVVWR